MSRYFPAMRQSRRGPSLLLSEWALQETLLIWQDSITKHWLPLQSDGQLRRYRAWVALEGCLKRLLEKPKRSSTKRRRATVNRYKIIYGIGVLFLICSGVLFLEFKQDLAVRSIVVLMAIS